MKNGQLKADYTFDAANMMTAAFIQNKGSAKYMYNGFGNIVKKLENLQKETEAGMNLPDPCREVRYILDMTRPYDNLLMTQGVQAQSFVWGNSLISRSLNSDNAGNQNMYYLQDHLYSPIRLLGDEGNSTPMAYDEFGIPEDNTVQAENTLNNPFGFTGYQMDNITGMYYAQARYYEPKVGRFMAEDPIKDRLNWYGYCDNNPVIFIDPSGLALSSTAMINMDNYEVHNPLEGGGGPSNTGNQSRICEDNGVSNVEDYIHLRQWVEMIGNWDWIYSVEMTNYDITGFSIVTITGSGGSAIRTFTAGENGTRLIDGRMHVRRADFIETFGQAYAQPGLIHNPVRDGVNLGLIASAPAAVRVIINVGRLLRNTSSGNANTSTAPATNPGTAESTNVGNVNTNRILNTANQPYRGGESIAGHSLQKHAGRNANVWGRVQGGPEQINQQAMNHINEIIRAPGGFQIVTNDRGVRFLEKMLPDGRGIRLNLDGTFKGFIDQIR